MNPSLSEIKCCSELSEQQLKEAVNVFVNGFESIMVFGTKEELFELFYGAINESLGFVLIKENCIIGYIGIGIKGKSPFTFTKKKCQQIFGNVKGQIVYKQLQGELNKQRVHKAHEVYINFLTTKEGYRGQGCATTLIHYICDIKDFKTCYIDVLAKNEKALRLYEYLGFIPYKKVYDFMMIIQGIGHEVKLKKHL